MNNLYEETHDLSKLKPFFNFATEKFNKKVALGFYDVTKYFKDFIPKNSAVKIILSFRSLKIDGAGGTASTSKNVALIKINKKIFYDRY